MLLATPEKIARTLQQTPVAELWGIGYQLAGRLTRLGIQTAWQLRNMNEEWVRKNMGGVTGVRLLRELKGIEAIAMLEPLDTKKMIATTRMFGSPVSNIKDIREAIATYTSRAAEKLRRQFSAASVINIFVVPKVTAADRERKQEKEEMKLALATEKNWLADAFTESRNNRKTDEDDAERASRYSWGGYSPGPTVSAYAILPNATAYTHELIKPAMQLVEQVF